MQRTMQMVVLAVVALAVIGLGYQMIYNPIGLLTRVLFIAGFVAVIFFLYRLYLAKRFGTPIMPKRQGPSRSQLKKAKRTSTVKKATPSRGPNFFKATNGTSAVKKKAPYPKSAIKKRADHNFTVIEGKKNKKKNRALF
ncbi:SA1362 family protein [Alkalihalophilus marmarensis]|uniref:SA1362 family protein n=1 Tax=Alkalihalophilus marmarensis TaxID=521377 RepID=UPI002DBCB3C6|nr:SA1362 family protein [Alkalihalophilus marmarensis]MEC2073817.1 SA1362 family protein [Alkalihalophilus marmarensis]